ncbi:hypothetical protein HPB52_009269 [Rhipicephalus sanguineus]|uniref:Uncharacterized protein n=1 Tax=Rhipicephalus sanguineus TaxID=34632 RepID=A0A9D4T927_RHISA|nr:hypothetical protein HPB52_009269 [Rhipicephalus sanguineus]
MSRLLVLEAAGFQKRRTVGSKPPFLTTGPLMHQMPSSSVSTMMYPYTVPDAEGGVVDILCSDTRALEKDLTAVRESENTTAGAFAL